MEKPNLIPPNWHLEFHVDINALLLVIGALLTQNPTSNYDQPIVYGFKLFNKT
jgi:hypothetical protein